MLRLPLETRRLVPTPYAETALGNTSVITHTYAEAALVNMLVITHTYAETALVNIYVITHTYKPTMPATAQQLCLHHAESQARRTDNSAQ